LSGFQARVRKIQIYLARLRPRIFEPPGSVPSRLRSLAIVVHGLLRGFLDPAAAFTFHARRFHQRFKVGLA
jgi:hypothetical protein